MKQIFIGTSGWSYKAWRESFYKNVPQKKWLVFYSEIFNSVEINATFYRSLKPSVYKKWTSITPQSFCFVVKGTRQITHLQKLEGDIKTLLLKQKENLSPLLKKTKVVLWQFPPSFKKNLILLENFFKNLAKLWYEQLHVIEFRNKTWFDEETLKLMEKYHIANCISDSPKWPMWEVITSKIAYVRFHGHTVLYRSEYTEEELKMWAKKIKQWLDSGKKVFVFFDNTDSGAAPYDAMKLKELVTKLKTP